MQVKQITTKLVPAPAAAGGSSISQIGNIARPNEVWSVAAASNAPIKWIW